MVDLNHIWGYRMGKCMGQDMDDNSGGGSLDKIQTEGVRKVSIDIFAHSIIH